MNNFVEIDKNIDSMELSELRAWAKARVRMELECISEVFLKARGRKPTAQEIERLRSHLFETDSGSDTEVVDYDSGDESGEEVKVRSESESESEDEEDDEGSQSETEDTRKSVSLDLSKLSDKKPTLVRAQIGSVVRGELIWPARTLSFEVFYDKDKRQIRFERGDDVFKFTASCEDVYFKKNTSERRFTRASSAWDDLVDANKRSKYPVIRVLIE